MRKVFITATVVNPDTEENYHGWIDLNWNRFQLLEDKELVGHHDVEDGENALDVIESLIGAVEISDGETFYAQDGQTNMESGEVWIYAAHLEA